ncbi:MAG: SRPBCC family protein [Pseudomonadota bacterium]
MFGFNKNKRAIEGPIEFTAEVEINRPAFEVFPLIDVSDPRFSPAQRGAEVRAVDGKPNHFEMTVEEFDDAVFHFNVLERVEGLRHKAECEMVPHMFALVKAVEEHTIEPVGEGKCLVKICVSADFDPDLSDEEVANEAAMMSMAVTGDLEKLAVHAEEGLEAVKALEEDEFNVEFDLGELDIDWDEIEPEQ